jgi:hypothetical protein
MVTGLNTQAVPGQDPAFQQVINISMFNHDNGESGTSDGFPLVIADSDPEHDRQGSNLGR